MSSMHGFVGEDEKKLDWPLFKRLLLHVRPHWKAMALSASLLLLVTLGDQAKPWLIKAIIDKHVEKHDVPGILFWAAIFMLSVVLVFSLQAWQTIQSKGMGQSLVLGLRSQIFRKIHAQPLRWFDKNPVGGMMTRVIYDVDALNQLFTAGLAAVFQDFFTMLVVGASLLYMDWRLGLVSIALLPVIAWGTVVFRKRARQNFREIRANTSKINSFLSESLSGMPTIQAFGAEDFKRQAFDVPNAQGLRLLLYQVKISALYMPLAHVLSALSLALTLAYGGWLYLENGISMGTLVASALFISRFFEPLRDFSEKFGILQSAMASSERIFALLDRKEEVEDAPDSGPAPKLKGALEFKNIWFSYETGQNILKGISFKVEPGQRLAVVGPTGAGKTSLLNVLYRFYPLEHGEVLFDGVEQKRYTRESLRKQMALVPQDPFLFSGSLLENLRLSDSSVPQERVEWACRQTQAHAFIEKLQGGYGYELKEGGSDLSTGQKQLLAFARALIFDPAILILDEATSSVDTATEEMIQNAMEVLLRGRTSITIAHRLSTVLSADKILVMKDGEIAEEGRHEELMKMGGLYRSLVELQFREVA